MSIRKLEDLTVWKRAKQVNNQAYQVIKTINDFDYQRQMKRSALSIPSNIAEGFGRRSDRFFIQYLSYSMGSLMELKTQLIICVELGLTTSTDVAPILSELEELASMIFRLSEAVQRRVDQNREK
jgi:four helix bundle protein